MLAVVGLAITQEMVDAGCGGQTNVGREGTTTATGGAESGAPTEGGQGEGGGAGGGWDAGYAGGSDSGGTGNDGDAAGGGPSSDAADDAQGGSLPDGGVGRRAWTFADDLEGWNGIKIEQPDAVDLSVSYDPAVGTVPGSAKVQVSYTPAAGPQTCRVGVALSGAQDLRNTRWEINVYARELPYWITVAAMVIDGSGRIQEGANLRLTSLDSNTAWRTLSVTPSDLVTTADIRYLGLVVRYDSGGYGACGEGGLCDGACCSRAYSILNLDNARIVNVY